MATTTEREQLVATVRRFNRFYTHRIGVLQEGLVASPFSLTEARVLYELAQGDRPTASELGRALGLDAGYLSRILRGFEAKGLLVRTPSPADARQSHLGLTAAGRAAFADLDARQRAEVAGMLHGLAPADAARLAEAMGTIERLLAQAAGEPPYTLRGPLPGDYGWIVHRHGALYAREYGFDARFEALVAEIVGAFARSHDPARERLWVAELGGKVAGSVMVVDAGDGVARLRLLYVEAEARGLGLGQRLVAECTRFAKAAGYRKLTLWTNDVLVSARRLYEAAGYRLVEAEPHAMFGPALTGETWELAL